MRSAIRSNHRHGFTLVELTTSLVITSILMLGLSSVMLIGSKAIPTGNEPVHAEAACARLLEDIAGDLVLATGITLVSSGEIIIAVADRDGDASKEQIRYSFDSDAGTISKKWNSDAAAVELSDVSAFTITLTKSGGSTTAALIELSMSSITSPNQNMRVDLYNNPETR